jgi:hypothetical protein
MLPYHKISWFQSIAVKAMLPTKNKSVAAWMDFLESQKPKNKFKIPRSDNAMIAVIMLLNTILFEPLD